MPNHVTNTLSLMVDSLDADTELQEILNAIAGEEEGVYIDFEKIIPPPDNMFSGNLGHRERQQCLEEGIPNWYDWQCANWGTKWNAYAQSISPVEYGEVTLQFDTAWSPPEPIIEALREKFPNLIVAGHWVEEGHQSAGVF